MIYGRPGKLGRKIAGALTSGPGNLRAAGLSICAAFPPPSKPAVLDAEGLGKIREAANPGSYLGQVLRTLDEAMEHLRETTSFIEQPTLASIRAEGFLKRLKPSGHRS